MICPTVLSLLLTAACGGVSGLRFLMYYASRAKRIAVGAVPHQP